MLNEDIFKKRKMADQNTSLLPKIEENAEWVSSKGENGDGGMMIPKNTKQKPLPPIEYALQEIFVKSGSMRTFMINFLLVYNIRFGIALLGRIATLMRTSPKTLFDLGEFLSEKHLHFREEAVRMGMFVASFSGIYISIKRALRGGLKPNTLEKPEQEWYDPLIAGSLAGFSLLWMDKSWHRTLALYAATRAAQCFYNFSKAR
jgi:hypothetical protein